MKKFNVRMFSVLLFLIAAQEPERLDLSVVKGKIETGKRVSVNLSWSGREGIDHYVVLKKRDDAWESISVFDFLDDTPVRVLNVYPDVLPESYSNTLYGSRMIELLLPDSNLVI